MGSPLGSGGGGGPGGPGGAIFGVLGGLGSGGTPWGPENPEKPRKNPKKPVFWGSKKGVKKPPFLVNIWGVRFFEKKGSKKGGACPLRAKNPHMRECDRPLFFARNTPK